MYICNIIFFCHLQKQIKYSANYKNIKYENRDLLKIVFMKRATPLIPFSLFTITKKGVKYLQVTQL